VAGSSPRSEPAGSQTLERGLAVLVELARHADGLTTSQVAEACGLHRSIAHRLLVSLHRTGFAARDDEGRFTVGETARGLGVHTPSLREVATPVLDRLARLVGATASLVEVVGDHAVTTVVAEPPTDGPRFSYRLGSHDPLDRGAGGLAALASGPARPGEPERVAGVRAAGHVTTHGELNPGAFGIAAPLPGWPVRAALTVVTGHEELTRTALGPLLDAAAAVAAARSRPA
jgi:DNA-binding IclR family transcriptional regulator